MQQSCMQAPRMPPPLFPASIKASSRCTPKNPLTKTPRPARPTRKRPPPQVRRWFEDTLAEAQRGDVKQQALLAQMYAEGYGTPVDLKAAAEWAERARSRGYRMKGVYCEL
jgi:TPR repeat protein